MQQLSANFTLADVMKSDKARELGINNTPPAEVVERAISVAVNILERVAQHYGVQNVEINSWFRCEALEKAICAGAYASWRKRLGLPDTDASWKRYFAAKQHPKGDAVDFEVKGVSNEDLFNWVKANLEFDQLILEFHKKNDPRSGWVHVSHVPVNNRRQAFRIG